MYAVCSKVMETTRHQDFILNMDQTPDPFMYKNARKMLEIVGRCTLQIRKCTCDTKRATFAMTVAASGKVLKPVIICKGVRDGRIVQQREFPNYENDMVYLYHCAAWMDEAAMLEWVDLVLQSYIELAPAGVMPILFRLLPMPYDGRGCDQNQKFGC